MITDLEHAAACEEQLVRLECHGKGTETRLSNKAWRFARDWNFGLCAIGSVSERASCPAGARRARLRDAREWRGMPDGNRCKIRHHYFDCLAFRAFLTRPLSRSSAFLMRVAHFGPFPLIAHGVAIRFMPPPVVCLRTRSRQKGFARPAANQV